VVDAPYAIPNEELGIKDVKERLYRGFERTMDELQEAIDIFKERKSRILFTINNFSLLSERTKRDMIWYIDDFYKIIENKRMVRTSFISNARKN
jgi:collagenase-like PrtC family protease